MDPHTGAPSIRFPTACANCSLISIDEASLPSRLGDVRIFFSPWNTSDAVQVNQTAHLAMGLPSHSFGFVMCESERQVKTWLSERHHEIDRPLLPLFILMDERTSQPVFYKSFAHLASHLAP